MKEVVADPRQDRLLQGNMNVVTVRGLVTFIEPFQNRLCGLRQEGGWRSEIHEWRCCGLGGGEG